MEICHVISMCLHVYKDKRLLKLYNNDMQKLDQICNCNIKQRKV